MDKEERSTQVLQKVNEWRDDGHGWPRYAYLAGKDPDFAEALNALSKLILTRQDALPTKTKQIIMSVLLATRFSERCGAHIERAMDAGATEAELIDALETSLMITGAPTLLYGIDVLSKVVESRKAAGKNV